MKIAIITDDGKTISQHFGRAQYYQVLTITDSKVSHSEMRPKLGHQHFHSTEAEHNRSHEGGHGHNDGEAHSKHLSMAEVISDCQVLLCGGMGTGAYNSMLQMGIKPMVTNYRDIESAAQAFIAGDLVDHVELLH